MSPTIIILTEDALLDVDVAHILGLHGPEDVRYHVLVPADTERNLFVALLDELYIGGPRHAWEAVREGEPDTKEATSTAQEQLATTLAELHAGDAQADGEITEDDPLPALRAAVAATSDVESVIVVTRPHAVEDTFRQDWASRAREELHVPVLHIYSGTSMLG